MPLKFLENWARRAEHRRQMRAAGQALNAVHAAALARPLPADQLAAAARAALAAGAPPLRVCRVAAIGASMSNPADPADFGHRELVYATVRRAVYGGQAVGTDDLIESLPEHADDDSARAQCLTFLTYLTD